MVASSLQALHLYLPKLCSYYLSLVRQGHPIILCSLLQLGIAVETVELVVQVVKVGFGVAVAGGHYFLPLPPHFWRTSSSTPLSRLQNCPWWGCIWGWKRNVRCCGGSERKGTCWSGKGKAWRIRGVGDTLTTQNKHKRSQLARAKICETQKGNYGTTLNFIRQFRAKLRT